MRHVTTVAMMLLCGQTALAQERADTSLRAALTALPAGIFVPTSTDLTSFLDLSLLAELHGGQLDPEAFRRGQSGAGLRPVDALVVADPEEWSAAAGTDLAGLGFVAGYGQPPHEVALWGFVDEAAASGAFGGLPARGFSPFGTQPGVVANGEPGRVDLSARNPADPWRGKLGKTSVVTQRGAILLQAADPEAFAPILDAPVSAADSATGATVLAGLEAQDGVPVQALLFGPALGLHSGIDVSVLMTASPDKAVIAIEQAMSDPVPGVPLYSGAILADLQGAEGPVMVLALAYGDCATAEAAAAQAAALWSESAPDMGEALPSHVDAGDAGCAAVISVAGDGEVNAPFDHAIRAMMQRNLLPIRIAME